MPTAPLTWDTLARYRRIEILALQEGRRGLLKLARHLASGDKSRRNTAPLACVTWHVRACCEKHRCFLDFVLSRFRSMPVGCGEMHLESVLNGIDYSSTNIKHNSACNFFQQ